MQDGSDGGGTGDVGWGRNTPDGRDAFLAGGTEHQSERPRLNYTLAIDHPDHGVIGGCGIYITSTQNRNASIGYCLNSHHWGKGYATEIAGKLIAYGFEALAMHRITAACDPRNTASWRVMEHNAMTLEGRLREDKQLRGEWRDSYLYSILHHEYGPNGSRGGR